MEIQAIMRQITASVSFLPMLDTACKIYIYIYLFFPFKLNEMILNYWIIKLAQQTHTIIFLGTFNILAYTDKDAVVPTEWVDSDPKYITRNAEQVKLRSFSTSVHKVDAMVAYRVGDE